jgi:hypothetical protein
MVEHEHEAKALSPQLFELMVEHSQNDSVGVIQFEQPPTTINRECQKEDISLISEFTAFVAQEPSIQIRRRSLTQIHSATNWMDRHRALGPLNMLPADPSCEQSGPPRGVAPLDLSVNS